MPPTGSRLRETGRRAQKRATLFRFQAQAYEMASNKCSTPMLVYPMKANRAGPLRSFRSPRRTCKPRQKSADRLACFENPPVGWRQLRPIFDSEGHVRGRKS